MIVRLVKIRPKLFFIEKNSNFTLILPGGFMNIFVKGIAASLMGVLMTGTAAQGGEIAVIETTLGNIELEFLDLPRRRRSTSFDLSKTVTVLLILLLFYVTCDIK